MRTRKKNSHKQSYVELTFVPDEYKALGWDFDTLPDAGYLASPEFQQLTGSVAQMA